MPNANSIGRLRYADGRYWDGFMELNDSANLARRLVELKTEHRDLDLLINRLAADQSIDQLTLTRMKKRKLRLKDEIAWVENKLIPDLDA